MITAKIVADSLSPQGDRITTMEVVFPRIVLAEAKTHRIISGLGEQVEVTTSCGLNDEFDFSRNSASSRAIPFKKMVKMVEENPFIPIAWQKDHKGMQGTEYFKPDEAFDKRPDLSSVEVLTNNWLTARDKAIATATHMSKLGVTKQLCNRLLEPFMYHKVLVTSTEWENFFKLRCPVYTFQDKIYRSKKDLIADILHMDYRVFATDEWFRSINQSQAEIHIQALAEAMWDAMNESTPKQLEAGEWHIPYGDIFDGERLGELANDLGLLSEGGNDERQLKLLPIKIATARCARISYQTLGDNPVIDYSKDIALHDMLLESEHMSPFEHCARAMSDTEYNDYWNGVVTQNAFIKGMPSESKGWCRNFKGFIQYRELVEKQ